MKILALLPAHRPAAYTGRIGGGEISNRILLEGLVAVGHEVIVVSVAGGGAPNTISNGVRIVEVRGSRRYRMLDWLIKRLLYRRYAEKHIIRESPDVLITTTEAITIGVTLGQAHRVPTAVFVRAFENLDAGSRNDCRRIVEPKRLVNRCLLGECGPRSLLRADLLLPNSEFMARLCRERFPGVPAAVVYPPLDIHVCDQRGQRVPAVVSMVGTSQKKGTAMVFRIAEHFPQIEFRIVGCPEVMAGDIVRDGNVARVGWCDTRVEFRENADIVLVPSVWPEPFGRVAIESLAAGKIPLVADVGGLPETVAYEPDLIVAGASEVAWVSRVQDVVNNPAKYQSAVASARAHLGKFRSEAQVSELERALWETVGSEGK